MYSFYNHNSILVNTNKLYFLFLRTNFYILLTNTLYYIICKKYNLNQFTKSYYTIMLYIPS